MDLPTAGGGRCECNNMCGRELSVSHHTAGVPVHVHPLAQVRLQPGQLFGARMLFGDISTRVSLQLQYGLSTGVAAVGRGNPLDG